MSDKHLPGCPHVQNIARPRSLQLIGPKCTCQEFFNTLDQWQKWLDSDEGKQAIADAMEQTNDTNP